MSQLPLPPKHIIIASYADEKTLTKPFPFAEKLRELRTPYLKFPQDWLESRKFKLSAEKSSATVFTTWSKAARFDPHLTINNSPIPVNYNVEELAVTSAILDNM